MKKILYLCLALFLFKTSHAQYGVQFSLMAPVKNLSYILKPGPGIEFTCKAADIDKRFKFGGSVGYFWFHPTQDTFRTYGLQSGGSGTFLLPGYEVVKSYKYISFGLTSEYKLLKKKKLSPIIGLDTYFYLVDYSEDTYVETLMTSSVTHETTWEMAIAPKIGLSYEWNETWLFNIGCARSMGFGPPGRQSFWKPYLSVNYYFD